MSALPEQDSADYDSDFYAWTQEQARSLRRLKSVNLLLPSGLDIDHIAEEIEDMGRSDLRSAKRLISNAIVHMLKICSAPEKAPAAHWKSEANAFLLQLGDDAYAPSMRQRIDMHRLWVSAVQQAQLELDEYGDELVADLPLRCPLSLDDLVEAPPRIDAVLAKLAESIAGNNEV